MVFSCIFNGLLFGDELGTYYGLGFGMKLCTYYGFCVLVSFEYMLGFVVRWLGL